MAKMRTKVNSRFDQMRFPKFLTLTLRENDQPCDVNQTRILDCFARLRRTDYWKQKVKGGLWVIEMQPRAGGRSHHVHIHALIDTWRVDLQWLSAKWREITGDSFQVDIKVPKSKDGRYLCKYISKGVTAIMPDENPWLHAERIHGRRMFGTFGNVPSLSSDDEDNDVIVHGTLASMLAKARAGDAHALDILTRATDRFLAETAHSPPKRE